MNVKNQYLKIFIVIESQAAPLIAYVWTADDFNLSDQ